MTVLLLPTLMFRIVWLLCNLSLDDKLCLRDDKNTAFVFVLYCVLFPNADNRGIRLDVNI